MQGINTLAYLFGTSKTEMKVLNSDTLSVCANGLRGPDWKEKEVEKDVEKEVAKAGPML